MIDGKRAASGARRCIQSAQPRRGTGEGIKGRGGSNERARLRTVGGYKGGREKAGAGGRKARRGEKIRRGVLV